MIYVTGDLHGDMSRIQNFHIPSTTKEQVILLVAGDFGFWDDEYKDMITEFFAHLPRNLTVMFCDGNHEDFTLLEKYPIKSLGGGKVRQIFPNLYHLMRGEVYVIENQKILVFGGATSIDKHKRIPYQSWWPQENWSEEDLNKLESLINDPNLTEYGVNVVLTHEAPAEIFEQIKKYSNKKEDFIPRGLQMIKEYIPFKEWYFGHHHFDFEVEGTKDYKMFGVYNEIRLVKGR